MSLRESGAVGLIREEALKIGVDFSGDSSSLNHSRLISDFVLDLSNNTQRKIVIDSILGQLLRK